MREPGRRFELVRELRAMSPAGWFHGKIAIELGHRLANQVTEHGLGTAFAAATGFVLARHPDTVRAPDVAFVRAGRAPAETGPGFFEGAPDLAVEVVSPSDSWTEVEEKALCWLAHGTTLVWVVDPTAGTVTALRSPADVRILRTGDELAAADLLPGFRCAVADLFAS